MPQTLLTDISIRNLKRPDHGQVTYWDTALKGFNVRVSQGGTKTYTLVHGQNRKRLTIGRVGIISLKDARARARAILSEDTLHANKPPAFSFEEAMTLY